MNRLRRLVSVMMIVPVMGLVTGAQCPGKKTAVKAVAAKQSTIPDTADYIAFGLQTLLTNKGVNNGVLLSDTAIGYDDGAKLELRRVNVTFYTSQGLKDGVMTSRTGLYNSRLSRLEATGDVVVIRNDGMRVTSPQLVYDQARNQIFTDSAFVLHQDSRVFTGIGFESDPQMNNFQCLQSCKGIAPVQIPRK